MSKNTGSFDTIIQGGSVSTASGTFVADIGIRSGRISTIGGGLSVDGCKNVMKAKGKIVVPGGVDVHTHLDMPFMGATTADDFASGTTAAVCGGTTSIIDFAIQEKGQPFRKAFDVWSEKAAGKSAVDYGFHMIVSDLNEARIKEMDEMIEEGVTTFKFFMAYPGIFMSDDASIFRALMKTKENGAMVCMHAENGYVIDILVQEALKKRQTEPQHHALSRPVAAEAEATRRSIALAEMADAPLYIVHLSAAAALEEVRRARSRGVRVFAETCPQYLYLSHDDYLRPGFEGAKFVMSPPLRPKGNQEPLWNGLRDGSLQIVSTDHCSFRMSAKGGKMGKELGLKDFSKIPNGAPGIETRMMLLWDAVSRGLLDANRFVELTSTTPAKLFGLYPRKGTITPGADADLLVIDPKKKVKIDYRKLHMNVDYNPYEGRTLNGFMQDVLVRGKTMVENGKFVGSLQHGSFLKRAVRMN